MKFLQVVKQVFFTGGFFLILVQNSSAQPNNLSVSGEISDTTTWNYDTVKVTGDLRIMNNVLLTITPGTVIEFQGNYKFSVGGTIIARGTKEDTIVFTMNDTTGFWDMGTQEGGWHGFHFDRQNEPWLYYADTSCFEYCLIEFGKSTGPDMNWVAGEKLGGAFLIKFFSKLVISHCRLQNNMALEGGAIYAYSSSPVINNSIITESHAWDAAITVESNSKSLLLSNNISNNHCRGIYASSGNPRIINNLITNNNASFNFQYGCG